MLPTAGDTPAATPVSSLDDPRQMPSLNQQFSSSPTLSHACVFLHCGGSRSIGSSTIVSARIPDAVIGQENDLCVGCATSATWHSATSPCASTWPPKGTNLPPGIAGWHPCQDASGNGCVLGIAHLAAGGVNIATPIARQPTKVLSGSSIRHARTPDVDHFCLHAEIDSSASNHDNDCVYRVQSNVRGVPGLGI